MLAPQINIEQLKFTLDNVPAYVYIKDQNSCYLYGNQLTLQLFQCAESELVGCGDEKFFPSDVVKRLRQIDRKVLDGQKTEEEIITVTPDGRRVVYWEVKTPIYDTIDTDQVVGILGISTDITQRKELEERLFRHATTDSLTGLYNRRFFLEQTENAMARSERIQSHCALLFIDLDDFKQLNDQHGHVAGDRYLVEIATEITAKVRSYDCVARYAGDEFIILLEDLGSTPAKAFDKATKIRKKVEQAVNAHKLTEVGYQGTVSCGLTIFSGSQKGFNELLSEADSQMYRSKKESNLS